MSFFACSKSTEDETNGKMGAEVGSVDGVNQLIMKGWYARND